MIETLVLSYLAGLVFFLVSSLQRAELYHLDMQIARSRETKALLRQCIARSQKDILMSFVWPALLLRLGKSTLSVMRPKK